MPSLRIAGVDDAWRKLTDLDSALEVDSKDNVILLSHDPDLFPASADQGVSLQVSGHAHGGQIAIPGFGRSGSILRPSACLGSPDIIGWQHPKCG